MNLFRKQGLLAVAVATLAAVSSVYAADEPAPAANDPLAPARAQIAQNSWKGAIAELQRVNLANSADWNNLMGYSHRKMKTPDLEAAERYYDAALRIDPKHRGALEYSGELYLQLGQMDKAEQRLATLNKVCFLPCAEYTELKKAIERVKSGGWQP
jgi:tetratricopeptide (TPR) repeat protein